MPRASARASDEQPVVIPQSHEHGLAAAIGSAHFAPWTTIAFRRKGFAFDSACGIARSELPKNQAFQPRRTPTGIRDLQLPSPEA